MHSSFYMIREWHHSASTLERSTQTWQETIWRHQLVNNHWALPLEYSRGVTPTLRHLQHGVLIYDTHFGSHCKLRLCGTIFGLWCILKESLHKEAHLDEVSEHKSPWQQRRPCKHMTLSPRVLKVSALYYKSKNLQHAQLQESSVEKI